MGDCIVLAAGAVFAIGVGAGDSSVAVFDECVR